MQPAQMSAYSQISDNTTFCYISVTIFRFRMAPGRISHPRTEKYSAFVAAKLEQLRNENILTDFKIHLKDSEITCHKLTLAVHSPVLLAAMTTNMAEAAKQEIKLDHISKDTMVIILDYMYYGDLNLDPDQLLKLIDAAEYLQMDELKSICVAEVPGTLEPGNAISWCKKANEMELGNIKTKCEAIMFDNFHEVSKQTDFLCLSYEELQSYLSDICSKTVKSDDALDSVMRWVNHNLESRLQHLECIVEEIPLDKCSARSIITVIKTNEAILDKQTEVFKLLNNALMDEVESMVDAKSKPTLMVIGGQVDEEMSPVCWNIAEAGQFEEFCDIPSVDLQCRHSICKTPQGFAITGGENSDLCIMFLAASRSWIRMQNMPNKRFAHGSVCVKGLLLVLGGHRCFNGSSSKYCGVDFLLIDNGGSWQKGQELPFTAVHPKVSSIDKSAYLLNETTKKLVRFDIINKIWSKRASLPVDGCCNGVCMTSTKDKLYVAGGHERIFACYEHITDVWTTMRPQPVRVHLYGSLISHNNKILLLGGSYRYGTDKIEEYNVEDDAWSVCAYKMPGKLFNHHGLVLDFQTHH